MSEPSGPVTFREYAENRWTRILQVELGPNPIVRGPKIMAMGQPYQMAVAVPSHVVFEPADMQRWTFVVIEGGRKRPAVWADCEKWNQDVLAFSGELNLVPQGTAYP